MKKVKGFFVVSGANHQMEFMDFDLAKQSAQSAPWADGRVWAVPVDFSGDPALGEDAILVYQRD